MDERTTSMDKGTTDQTGRCDLAEHKIDKKALAALAVKLGADKASFIKTADISFSDTFKDMCAMNTCGKYNTNWMCPPAVGSIGDGIATIRTFEEGLIIQTVSQLEDSFDYEGMQLAAARHDKVFREIAQAVRTDHPGRRMMVFGVGGCSLCTRCTYLDGLPCIQPERAVSSVEAYGIDVNRMLTAAGLKYNNGVSTVSYVGLILLDAAFCG